LRHGKTLVVGVGEVGGALAEVLERTQPDLLRHDLEPREFSDAIGVMHVCIPYQSRQQFETATLEYIQRFQPRLTVINSTVIPGTTRRIASQSRARLAYSPVRGKHARMTEDLLKYCKFIAADDDETASEAGEHFRLAGIKTRRVARPETLEVAKLAETTYFGIQIAFAQELNRFAEQLEADYAEAIDFFEEVDFLPRARYYPGFIGGHCVIPNIHLLKQVVNSPLLEAVLDSNQRRAAELAKEKNHPAKAQAQGGPTDEGKVLAHR
jgi:UDP-N-acetyl-D-mannosaminuronate dehydrogenase